MPTKINNKTSSSGRRKSSVTGKPVETSGIAKTSKELRGITPTRRKASPKPRKRKEKRQDMQIIVSASQGDIYIWAISLVIMAGFLSTFLIVSIILE